jgi:hypothetical protein
MSLIVWHHASMTEGPSVPAKSSRGSLDNHPVGVLLQKHVMCDMNYEEES